MSTRRTTASPRGHATLTLSDGRVLVVRCDFSAIADADQDLGRSAVNSLILDSANFHTIRTVLYHWTKGVPENRPLRITSVVAMGQLLAGLDIQTIVDAVNTALDSSGITRKVGDDEAGVGAGEA